MDVECGVIQDVVWCGMCYHVMWNVALMYKYAAVMWNVTIM